MYDVGNKAEKTSLKETNLRREEDRRINTKRHYNNNPYLLTVIRFYGTGNDRVRGKISFCFEYNFIFS